MASERRSNVGASLAVGLIVLACAVPLSYRIGQPFVISADNNTAAFAQAARNYLRYGLLSTRGGLSLDMGESPPPRLRYITHHPPLVSLMAAAAFGLLGTAEWTARLYPAVCSLGSALILYALWRRHRGLLPAVTAALAMATLPAYGHFGKMLGEEAPTLFYGLLTLLLYTRWREKVSAGERARLSGTIAAYLAGCFSGWAAFHIGPVLILDALVLLRHRPDQRRRAVAGFALAGTLAIGLILAHFALLTGSLDDIVGAAQGRAFTGTPGGTTSAWAWLRHEAEHFLKCYGAEAGALAGVGAAAGLTAVVRRRARSGPVAVALSLGAYGLAHPLVFRWAAYGHDWLLFHLLPAAALAVAEGILGTAGLLSHLLGRAGTPRRMAVAMAAAGAVSLLGHRAVMGERDLRRLATDEPTYAARLLGQEIGRLAPAGSSLASNFPFQNYQLRFYADRPAFVADRRAQLMDVMEKYAPALYVRDLNRPMEAELEEMLSARPAFDVGAFRIYPLGESRVLPDIEPAHAAGPPASLVLAAPLDALFEDGLRLTRCEVSAPLDPAKPALAGAAFLGIDEPESALERVVKVETSWTLAGPELPNWHVFVEVVLESGPGAPYALPLAVMPNEWRARLSLWKGVGAFRIVSAFFVPDRSPAGDYTVYVAVYDPADDYTVYVAVHDGGRRVPPVLAGSPGPLLKSVRVGTIPLPRSGTRVPQPRGTS